MKTNRVKKWLITSAGLIVLCAVFTTCKSSPPTVPDTAPSLSKQPSTTKPPLPSDAKATLKQAADNTLNRKMFSLDAMLSLEMAGIKFNITLDMEKENDIYHINVEFMGMQIEIFTDSKSVVMKNPMTRKWEQESAGADEILSVSNEMIGKIFSEYIQDARFVGEEKSGNINCRIIEAFADPKVLADALLKRSAPLLGDTDISFNKASIKVWVDKDNLLLVKTTLSLEGASSGSIMPGFEPPEEPEEDIEDEKETEEDKTDIENEEKEKDETGNDKKMRKVKYDLEINYYYDKLEPIIIPPEVKKLLEKSEKKIVPKTQPKTPDKK
ncbi:MAG: hypothetical protein QME51_10790 [Planctomycetota bacterium]|nr:hypothetical protein [Planctomycetota bacterium]